MRRLPRKWYIGLAIAILALLIITLVAAPTTQESRLGSSYNRSPDGYGAWYAFMEAQGATIQRGRQDLSDLIARELATGTHTVLRIYGTAIAETSQPPDIQNWVRQGNTLMVLGVNRFVTEAPFSSELMSPYGAVKVETRRRSEASVQATLLRDRFGAVVWRQSIGQGQIIFCTTPFLAANAYQEVSGNFEFLRQLALGDHPTTPPQIWFDEYIHGYKDEATITEAVGETLWSYFATTPLLPLTGQGALILVIVIWASNQRFGPSRLLKPVPVENSQAYIQALAGVLHKSQAHRFPLLAIAQAEQKHLQKQLGLGERLLPHPELLRAWQQQTGQSAEILAVVLDPTVGHPQISEAQLLIWLNQWQAIRQLTESQP